MPDESSDEIYLSDVSERDKPWDSHKAAAAVVRDLYSGSELENLAFRMETCANWLRYALLPEDYGERKFRLREARFCRCRYCPICQWRRKQMWLSRCHRKLPALFADYPTARFLYLTLTFKNCPVTELRSTIIYANEAWKRFSQRKAFPGVGWVKCWEVTRNSETGEAHPHMHIMVMVRASYFKGKDYLSHKKWQQLWRESLRVHYDPRVDVRVVKSKSGKTGDAQELLMSGLIETLKYSVKEDDLIADRDFLIELTAQMHGMRTIAIGGVMRKYLNDNEPGDLINDGEPDLDLLTEDEINYLVFDWRTLIQRYALKI